MNLPAFIILGFVLTLTFADEFKSYSGVPLILSTGVALT